MPNAPTIALRADFMLCQFRKRIGVDYRSARPGKCTLAATMLIPRFRWKPESPCIEPDSCQWAGEAFSAVGGDWSRRARTGKTRSDRGVAAIVALHVDPNREVGHLGVTPGPRTAFCQDFTIRVVGRAGHGARRSATVDPIAIAAQLITLIYQAVPRQIDSRDR